MEYDQPSFRGSIISHVAAVGLTLLLAALLFSVRFERPQPPHRIPSIGVANPTVAPAPVPSPIAEAELDAFDAAAAPVVAVASPPSEDALKELDPEERQNVLVYASVNKSVVNITTEAENQGFFGEETSTGTGSGFVTDKRGRILTNFHVVQGADTVRATLFDGSAHAAKVVGVDASNDVALLQIDAPADKLIPVAFGDSSKLLVGQKIMAIGNPFGLERTLTTGIVSSLDRSLKAKNGRMIRGIIQTDAAINPGNSGGPLLNTKGQVIGMNTAIISSVGQSAGVSFAVPINSIARILKPLIEDGRVVRADLGVTRFYATDEGLLVLALAEGGPAEQAGIRPIQVKLERVGPGFMRRSLDPDSADLIVAVDHKRVKTLDELMTEVEKHQPGQSARITVVRDGKPMDVVVQLGKS
ncbi:MAG: trypsin-like peptidase domain-containing protein [Paludisphaera borealis]|uniref:S1C family serine protease n=1 Tax=Paludisphaera borealis TaxID=1387353 RepID=UPI0028482E8B|nr:trypsin-like peptidase domain-containing protein [Paludisphaera borealis]MDR3620001.1 trypsin-like peptidase domain-containing protein [Paludisphaera borealis]